MRVHCPLSSSLFIFHEHVLGGAVRRDEHRHENVREDDRDEEAWRRAIGVASVRLSGGRAPARAPLPRPCGSSAGSPAAAPTA